MSKGQESLGLTAAAMQFGCKVPLFFPTLTSSFYYHAASYPELIAIHDLASEPPRELTYKQLATMAQALATKLRRLGVRPHHRVPLVVKRGAEMVIGIWAILSCGAQYVPLDGSVVPDSTIRLVHEQSGGEIIVCLPSTRSRIQELCPSATPVVVDENPENLDEAAAAAFLAGEWVDLATPDAGAYIIYTSGTTGKPKGVDVTHKNVSNLVCMFPGNLGIRPGNRVGQVLNISFDMAAWEIFSTLCNGGTLVIRGSKWEPTIQLVDTLICTPSILSKYPPTKYPNIKVVATAGEPTTVELADLWATHATYWNSCGPTETTIVNTMQKHIVGDGLSIGKPTPNNNVYILDDEGKQVEVGEPGVMWAGGAGVSRGYIQLPAKTEESYIPDPFTNDGSKMYCTGDLGRWRPDGSIEILGRKDDQVKVKGFRVELDGVASSIASFPGVTRATCLLINGEIQAFAVPASLDSTAILNHTKKLQPYYAVPSKLFLLEEFIMTANGKIDKQVLRNVAAKPVVTETIEVPTKAIIELPPKAIVKTTVTSVASDGESISGSSTVSTVSVENEKHTKSEKQLTYDLSGELPEKTWSKRYRNLRKRVLIPYRVLFGLVGIINIGLIFLVIFHHIGAVWLSTLTAINLCLCVLVRQDTTINALYWVFCSLPLWFPLWIRSRAAKIYHLGGVHSGAGFCATAWLVASTIQGTISRAEHRHDSPSIATLVMSWLLCVLCSVIVVFAYPTFRKAQHDKFETIHRFLGWTAVAFFWVKTVLGVNDTLTAGETLGHGLVRSPGFWLLLVATFAIASSWFYLRKVKVNAEPMSEHAVRLHFDYAIPVNGAFARLSHRPLIEWHSFATIGAPEPTEENPAGFSLVVSNAGDWTKDIIANPPTKIWVRSAPTCGVMRIATLFKRVVLISTGSGIGPMLGHINNPSCPSQLIWSTPNPEMTFGKKFVDLVKSKLPSAIIHDTRKQGRPDLVKMGYNLAKEFDAEAVIVIANEKITKKIVYGLETRGIHAYGAIWDS